MGRTVAVPRGVMCVGFHYSEAMGVTEEEANEEYMWFLESVEEYLIERFPSFERTDKWIGRECRVILENDFFQVGVSEYCGVYAIWAIEKEEHRNISVNFGLSLKNSIREMSTFRQIGTFSNGNAIYERKQK